MKIRLKAIFAPIGPDDTRVSVTQFGATLIHEIEFKDGIDKTAVDQKIHEMKFAESGSMAGLALKNLREDIFSEKAGSRSNKRESL